MVQNLLVDLTGRGKKVETKDFMTCTVVPLGTKGGVTQLYGMVWQVRRRSNGEVRRRRC